MQDLPGTRGYAVSVHDPGHSICRQWASRAEASLPSLEDRLTTGYHWTMSTMFRLVRSYPVVAWTLVVGAVVLGLVGGGYAVPAQWVATGYVTLIILLTGNQLRQM